MNVRNQTNDLHSLSHTKWNCKYHVVFAPKYRRAVFSDSKRIEIGKMLRELCEWKGVNIIEAEVCKDHVYMLIEVSPKISISGFMGFLYVKNVVMERNRECKKCVVMIISYITYLHTLFYTPLSVIAIPTIASTGSEMDKSCVIANADLGVKSGINGEPIRPKAAFLDPTNTFTVPPRQTACGGFDIMAHLFDMNYFVNSEKYPLQFNVVETLLKTVRKQLPIAIQEPENYEARATMLWAASWALNSFCTSGFKTQASLHALEQFSSSYDLTHGLGLAIIMPKWMKYLLDRDETVAEDFARFGVNVMDVKDSEDKKAVAYQTIEALQNFIKDELGLPVYLSELGLDDSKFDEMKIKACYGKESLPRAYRPLTQEDCLNIYKMCI